jgi:hypothetical protein
MPLLPVIRANGRVFSRNSVAVRLNGTKRLTDVYSIDWEDERPAEQIPANHDGGAPLGVALGDYKCSASIGIYADVANDFEDAVLGVSFDSVLPVGGIKNLTESIFQLGIVMREDVRSRFIAIINCRIVGRPSRVVSDDGKALVALYTLAPTLLIEDGKTLCSTGGATL